jgi:hypothetical protein
MFLLHVAMVATVPAAAADLLLLLLLLTYCCCCCGCCCCGKKGPEASNRLRLVNVTLNTGVCLAGKERMSFVFEEESVERESWSTLRRVWTSHNFTVLSPEPEARSPPSALKSSEWTARVCPVKRAKRRDVAKSHMCIVLCYRYQLIKRR